MRNQASDLNVRIAGRVRELRRARGLSLGDLAARSGVSRSMISLVERGESSATAVVLERLARGLEVLLASLFDPPPRDAAPPPSPLSRRAAQVVWRDPASGYLRRNVSPPGVSPELRIVEVHFPPGGRVAFETADRTPRVRQQIWLLKGAMEITVGNEHHRLGVGDCLAMELSHPILFHNPTRQPARYAVVLATETPSRR